MFCGSSSLLPRVLARTTVPEQPAARQHTGCIPLRTNRRTKRIIENVKGSKTHMHGLGQGRTLPSHGRKSPKCSSTQRPGTSFYEAAFFALGSWACPLNGGFWGLYWVHGPSMCLRCFPLAYASFIVRVLHGQQPCYVGPFGNACRCSRSLHSQGHSESAGFHFSG